MSEDECKDIDKAINRINSFSQNEMWDGKSPSPIWLRPLHNECKMFMDEKYLQVTGHTPVKKPVILKGVAIFDTFSTNTDGSKYGEERLVIVDTERKTWEYAE